MRQGVKCPAFDRFAKFAAVLVAIGCLVASRDATAQLLLGGGLGPKPPRPPAPLDAALPTGPVVYAPPRPATNGDPAACSADAPVCVHRLPAVGEKQAIIWRYALERAYSRLVDVLRLPPPIPDGDRGGNAFLDLYLVPGTREVTAALDAIDVGRTFDSASAYCIVGEGNPDVDRAATLCVGEALGYAVDAATTPFYRRALATALWQATMFAPSSADVTAIDDFQARPERAIVARDLTDQAEGSALFLDYLDAVKGRSEPGGIGLSTAILASRKPSKAGLRFENEPDALDVLRATFGPTPTDVARLFGDFAVARAFIGTRDGDGLFPTLAWTGGAGRPRFEWSVPFSSLPRLLSPSRPVEPTGATYLWVALDGDPGTQSFVFSADWEPPVAFRWSLVLVGGAGNVVKRIDVSFVERDTHVERIVTDLGGAAGILIAGTNMGGISPTYPFDPDFEPYEPHGYAAYLSKQ